MKNKTIYYIVGVVAVILVLAIIIFSSSSSSEDVVKIGVVLPMSGDMGQYGQSSLAAIKLAMKDLGDTIDGKKVKLVVEDGKCSGESASKAFNKLVNVDGVNFIIGGLCSSETLAGVPIIEESKTLAISSCSSAPSIRTASKYLFDTYPLDDLIVKYDSKKIIDMGYKKVAILSCQSDWCKQLADTFKAEFEALGGSVVIHEENEQNTNDLKTQLSKIKESGAELLYLPEYSAAIELAFKQSEELGLPQVKYVPQLLNQSLVDSLGSVAEGAYVSVLDVKLSDSYINSLKEISGLKEVDTLCSPSAYNAYVALKKAADEVGLDTEKVRDKLLNTEFDGITGKIKFDNDGMLAFGKYKLQVVKNGKLIDVEE